jgi:molybdopterin converting factor small subunit
MRVEILCFGAMREHLPADAVDNHAQVELDDEGTVASLMDRLGAPHALAHAVLVDGGRADLTTQLYEGAEVTLMPPFAGGG